MKPIIHAIAVKNFKSLRDTGLLNLKPITLLVGPNSSGKTALLQTILMLKQTLESRNIETPLVLRGRYVDLSSFKDIIFRHNIKEDIEISLGIKFSLPRIERFPKPLTGNDFSLIKFKIGYDAETERLVDRGIELSISAKNCLKIYNGKIQVTYEGETITSTYKSEREFEKRNFLYIPHITPSYFIFDLIDEEYRKLTEKRAQLEEMLKKEIEEEQRIKLERKIKYIERTMKNLERRYPHVLRELNVEQARIVIHMLNTLSFISYKLQDLLVENTYYIGPLREYPQRYYIASGEYPRDVGLRGEHTVEVIYFDFKRKEDRYVKLKRWMKEMDLACDVKLSPVAEGIYALSVTDPKLNVDVNLADIGFGASQLLPIIVEGIYAKKGSVLLIEQPEIHLHPKLQAMLADLFIDIVKDGKQVIVETHSEHILLRLQRRVAENILSHKDIAIYYFEPSEEGSKITYVEMNEDGTLKTWPKGFFEEDLEESYLLLKALAGRKNVSSS
jgi:predicted ATPase